MKRKIILLGPSAPYRGGIVHFNSRLGEELLSTERVETKLYFWKRLYPTLLLPKPEKSFQDNESKVNFLQKGDAILDYMNPVSWIRLVLTIRNDNPEIFITHWTQPIHFPVFWTLFNLIKLLTNSKIYLIAHNVKQHEDSFLNRFSTKTIFHMVDKVIVHAETEAVDARKFISERKVISAFIPLYDIFPEDKEFDADAFKNELGLKEKVILFFGFIRPYKGLEYLIEAFNIVRNEMNNVSLLIVGELFWKVDENKKLSLFERIKRLPFQILKEVVLKDDVEKYNPLALVSKLGIENDCVIVDNYVPNDDVFKYYKSADVFVAPYVSASQSAPVQIAYAFDKPVIVSSVGGLKDVVNDGVSGFLVKSKDSKELASKIIQFFNENNIRERDIRKYKRRFHWSEYIKLVLKS